MLIPEECTNTLQTKKINTWGAGRKLVRLKSITLGPDIQSKLTQYQSSRQTIIQGFCMLRKRKGNQNTSNQIIANYRKSNVHPHYPIKDQFPKL